MTVQLTFQNFIQRFRATTPQLCIASQRGFRAAALSLCSIKVSSLYSFCVANLLAFWLLRITFQGVRAAALPSFCPCCGGHSGMSRVVCVTWLVCMCDMTHSYVWHVSFVYVTTLNCMCDITQLYMTFSYVGHDLCIRVTWLIRMCDMTYSYICHDSCVCTTRHFLVCDVTCQYVRDVTHLYV